MAAIIYCWQQQQHVRGRTAQLSDISSGATCVADLDYGAQALTKEASGNSRAYRFAPAGPVPFCPYGPRNVLPLPVPYLFALMLPLHGAGFLRRGCLN